MVFRGKLSSSFGYTFRNDKNNSRPLKMVFRGNFPAALDIHLGTTIRAPDP
jgi:hypothetical protein